MTMTSFPVLSQKVTNVLICTTLIICGLYFGRQVLTPVFLAMLLSLLLYPLALFFSLRWKLNYFISVGLCILIALIVFGGLCWFIGFEISLFSNDLPALKKNIMNYYDQVGTWVESEFKIPKAEQEKRLQDMGKTLMSGGGSFGGVMDAMSSIVLNFTAIPILTFLFLLYRNLFVEFLFKAVPKDKHATLKTINESSSFVIQRYLMGILIETLIVSSLTGLGLFIIGVKYAVLLGVLTGVLNLIPYVGIILASVLSVFFALVSASEPQVILYIVANNVVVQFIDNNLLVPKIIGSYVKLNALVSIIVVIIGGMIAGVAGMFLSLPLTALVKIIFDNIESTEPYGYLLGDDFDVQVKGKIRDSKGRKRAAS